MDGQIETEQRTLLRLEKVCRTFRMGEVDVPVLRDVDLCVREGELLVVVGPSGSGKSTLLNIIGGVDQPSSGDVYFADRNVARFDDRQLTIYRREAIGYVFQFYNLVPTLTAWENVLVSTEIADDPMDARDALHLVDLDHRVGHFPSQLSGGEQQRVAIARAIAKRPRLLLCDEPTGALDLETGKRVLGLLERLNRELDMTVILITHNTAIAAMADRVVHLGSGRIVASDVHEARLDPEELEW